MKVRRGPATDHGERPGRRHCREMSGGKAREAMNREPGELPVFPHRNLRGIGGVQGRRRAGMRIRRLSGCAGFRAEPASARVRPASGAIRAAAAVRLPAFGFREGPLRERFGPASVHDPARTVQACPVSGRCCLRQERPGLRRRSGKVWASSARTGGLTFNIPLAGDVFLRPIREGNRRNPFFRIRERSIPG